MIPPPDDIVVRWATSSPPCSVPSPRRQHLGFPEFRPAQRRVIASVLAGRQVLAVLPTGGGKSLCFQIPALIRPGLTIVISPLISLMQDQVEAARRRGLPADFVNSSLDTARQAEVLEAVRTGRTRLLYVAPERLPRLARELTHAGVSPALLAVDEAHCISGFVAFAVAPPAAGIVFTFAQRAATGHVGAEGAGASADVRIVALVIVCPPEGIIAGAGRPGRVRICFRPTDMG